MSIGVQGTQTGGEQDSEKRVDMNGIHSELCKKVTVKAIDNICYEAALK